MLLLKFEMTFIRQVRRKLVGIMSLNCNGKSCRSGDGG